MIFGHLSIVCLHCCSLKLFMSQLILKSLEQQQLVIGGALVLKTWGEILQLAELLKWLRRWKNYILVHFGEGCSCQLKVKECLIKALYSWKFNKQFRTSANFLYLSNYAKVSKTDIMFKTFYLDFRPSGNGQKIVLDHFLLPQSK